MLTGEEGDCHGGAFFVEKGGIIHHEEKAIPTMVKPVRTPVAIFGSLGVCIYVPASRHWLISYFPIHLN